MQIRPRSHLPCWPWATPPHNPGPLGPGSHHPYKESMTCSARQKTGPRVIVRLPPLSVPRCDSVGAQHMPPSSNRHVQPAVLSDQPHSRHGHRPLIPGHSARSRPLARSAIAVRSLDSISSCVSKRDRAPELVIARLTAAMECESGRSKTAAPSYCPHPAHNGPEDGVR